MNLYPEEVLLEIFKFLDPKMILICGLVTKSWRSASENDLIWKRYINEKHFKKIEPKDFQKLTKNKLKSKYLYTGYVSSCWKNGTFQRKQGVFTSGSNTGKVMFIERSDDIKDLFVTSSSDCRLKLWTEKSLNPIFTSRLIGPPKYLKFDSKGIVHYDEQKDLKIMKLSENGTKIETKFETISIGTRESLDVSLDYISYVEGSDIQILNRDGKYNLEIKNNKDIERIKFSKKDPNLIMSFTEDKYIKIWDIRTPNKEVKSYKTGIKDQCQSIQFNDKSIGIELEKDSMVLIDYKTLKEFQVDYPHSERTIKKSISSLLSDKIVFSLKGGFSEKLSRFEVYDIKNQEFNKKSRKYWTNFTMYHTDAYHVNEKSILYAAKDLVFLDEIN